MINGSQPDKINGNASMLYDTYFDDIKLYTTPSARNIDTGTKENCIMNCTIK